MSEQSVLLHPLSCAASRHVISGGVTDETFCDCGLRDMQQAAAELARLQALVQRFARVWPFVLEAIANGQHRAFCGATYKGSQNERFCDCFEEVDALLNTANVVSLGIRRRPRPE